MVSEDLRTPLWLVVSSGILSRHISSHNTSMIGWWTSEHWENIIHFKLTFSHPALNPSKSVSVPVIYAYIYSVSYL